MPELVSVIVPVHNSSKYLKRCIDSIKKQTYKNIEIITVENGSTDDSLEILKTYKNIEIIKLEKASLGLARNTGIEKSKGKYISFIDSDDTIEKEFIEKLVKNIEEEKSDLAMCEIKEKYEENQKEKIREVYPKKEVEKEEIKNNLGKYDYGPCNKLYKKEIITKNKIEYPTNLKYEDVPFVLGYIISSEKITKIPEALYNYHIHKNSEQTTVDERITDIFEILELLKSQVNILQLEELYIKTLTTYSLKTRKLKSKTKRKEFIDKAYDILDETYSNWRNSNYIKSKTFLKRIIIKNRKILKIYTSLYSKIF